MAQSILRGKSLDVGNVRILLQNTTNLVVFELSDTNAIAVLEYFPVILQNLHTFAFFALL